MSCESRVESKWSIGSTELHYSTATGNISDTLKGCLSSDARQSMERRIHPSVAMRRVIL